MAVRLELLERLVAARRRIHRDAIDERVELGPRQMERLDERLQRLTLRRLGEAALEHVRHFLPPQRQRGDRARLDPVSRSTASSTARQKSKTAVIARRCGAGSTRNE